MPVAAIIRDPSFGRRLQQACDSSAHCPDLGRGRLTWIMDQFKQHSGETISAESVRRWLEGEVKPRHARTVFLAKILGVDATWLYLGAEGTKTSRRKVTPANVIGLIDAAAHLLEVHEAMGKGQSHAAKKLRQALDECRAAS